MLLLATDICTNASFLATVLFIKKLIKIISYIVPVVLVLLVSIDIVKAVIAGDDNAMKKIQSVAIKRVIYALLVFFVPVVVNAIFTSLGNQGVSGLDCYNNASDTVVDSLIQAENENLLKYQDSIDKLIEAARKSKEEAQKTLQEYRERSGPSTSISADVPNQYVAANGYFAEAAGPSKPRGVRGMDDRYSGDQSKEVRTVKYYGKWTYAARFKNPVKANLMAKCMEGAAKNNHIGYYGSRRLTLFEEAKKYNFDVSKVTKNVDTTCSNLICVCINYTGTSFPSEAACSSGALYKQLNKRSNDFTITKYSSNQKRYRGDIMFTGHHTGVVL